MLRQFLSDVYPVCFERIGGEENEDVRYILFERPTEVTRDAFFQEVVWAILVSGVSRKAAATFCGHLADCEFDWDYETVGGWSDPEWEQFLGGVYPDGISGRGRKKWAAIRAVAKLLADCPDEASFREEFFGGKVRSADLTREDIGRLADRGLSFVRYTNAQYVVRNLGGESIKCDRWIGALLDYLGVTGTELERALVAAGISLSLFDVVMWAYCESFVGQVADLPSHFDRLLGEARNPDAAN
jgi:hypothetical protein